jgi:hypothetical protein
MVYFQTKSPNLGNFLGGFAMERVGIFYGHLVYFTTIWCVLWSFGTFYGLFGAFFPVSVCCTKKKSGNPARGSLMYVASKTVVVILLTQKALFKNLISSSPSQKPIARGHC